MLPQNIEKGKNWVYENKNDLLVAVSFFLIAVISFGFGRLSVLLEEKEPYSVRIEENTALAGSMSVENGKNQAEQGNSAVLLYVGSKNGTVYHLPTCSSAKRINEENKIWFSSKEEAEALGYKPAKNCEGL